MRVLPTGELTFVFTDIEGSTRLLATLGPRYVDVHHEHQAVVRGAASRHDGIEVSTEGDSFFLVFTKATDAAMAASEILSEIERHPWPPDGRIRVRIGIHTGRAVLAADDYVGIDVNRAARIAAAANGGQILLSGATADLVRDATGPAASIKDLGRHRLKDVGVEQLYILQPKGLRADERAPRTLEAAPSNLPPPMRSLIDRVAEREHLTELLAEGRMVTVTGAGGIGKTALALDVANTVRARFVDGTGYVDLAGVDGVETAAAMLAEGLDLPSDPGRTASEALAEQLRGREVLLVIETAEHLPAIGDLLAALVRNCPRTRVLATSRVALHLQAERELRLEPLSTSSATDLFVSRARAVMPAFEPTEEDQVRIAEIADRLDGLPLAIELAAARTRVLSPAQILERLEKQLTVLTGGAVDAPSRQRTLRATVEWSYEQLTEHEAALLQALAVFAGDFELGAAEGLARRASMRIDTGAVLDLLDGLVDKSLVHPTPGGRARFRLLASIREFALEELAAAGQLEPARTAHFEWMLAMTQASSRAADSASPPADLPLRSHEDDLRSALAWALETPNHETAALELAAAAGPFWYAFSRAREGSTWLERTIAAAPDGRDEMHGDAHYWAGVLADERRDAERAIQHLELSLDIRRELDDDAAITRTINSLGVVSRTAGDLVRARRLLTECLERKRAANDPRLGSTMTNLAIVAVDEGQFEEALGLFQAALEADRSTGLSEPHPAVLLGIALVHVRLGDPQRAIESALTAAKRFLAVDDEVAVSECLDVLAEAWQASRQHEALIMLYASDAIHHAQGIARSALDETRLRAIGDSIGAQVAVDVAESAAAEGRVLGAAGAVAYAEAVAASDSVITPSA